MSETLLVNEIFYSIQGESTWAGAPCGFVRLTGCPLRCTYCDSEYAFDQGQRMSIDEVLVRLQETAGNCPLVEITGGEPLIQPAVHPLMSRLADAGKLVLLETSGAIDISSCDERVIRIMDIKTPGSGQVQKNVWSNLEHLRARDQVKFVLTSRQDYEWARHVIHRYDLVRRVEAVLFSPAYPTPPGQHLAGQAGLDPQALAQWILADHWPATVRLQLQLHKILWPQRTRGI